jgi:hypothetical protein
MTNKKNEVAFFCALFTLYAGRFVRHTAGHLFYLKRGVDLDSLLIRYIDLSENDKRFHF